MPRDELHSLNNPGTFNSLGSQGALNFNLQSQINHIDSIFEPEPENLTND